MPSHPENEPADRPKAPLRGQRPRSRRFKAGSILIMVVGLLVLLALIGTAFLSTSRADRQVSSNAVADTRIDLLVHGVEEMAKSTIANGLADPLTAADDPNINKYPPIPVQALLKANNDPYRFRHKFDEPDYGGTILPAPSGAGAWDAPDLWSPFTASFATFSTGQNARMYPTVDGWLSPRFPQPLSVLPVAAGSSYSPYNPSSTVPVPSIGSDSITGNPLPAWLCLGKPLVGDHFDSPFVLTGALTFAPATVPPVYYERLDPVVAAVARVTQSNLVSSGTATVLGTPAVGEFIPRFVQLPPNSGNWFPAWLLTTPTPTTTGGPYYYLAGDADGDGIADCGMFRLPSNLDGLTWYAGVRIIDNNSAINVNTAWNRDHDYDGTGTCDVEASNGTMGTVTGVGTVGPSAYQYGQEPFTMAQGMFTANVGLQQLLHTWVPLPAINFSGFSTTSSGTWTAGPPISVNAEAQGTFGEMTNLNEFRFNSQGLQMMVTPTAADPLYAGAPLGGGAVVGGTVQNPAGVFSFSTTFNNASHPVDEYLDQPSQAVGVKAANPSLSTVSRGDFFYLTMGDALESDLGRRLNNPGNLNPVAGSAEGTMSSLQAQRYGLEDSAALAYHFCFINPATITPGIATTPTPTAAAAPAVVPTGVFAPISAYPSGAAGWVSTYGFGVTGSKIERDLYRSVFDTAPNSPFPLTVAEPTGKGFGYLRDSTQSQYSPNLFQDGPGPSPSETVACWYRDNFQFEDEAPMVGAVTTSYEPLPPPTPGSLGTRTAVFPTNFKPRRSMLVASNPVSNLMPWVDPPDYNALSTAIPINLMGYDTPVVGSGLPALVLAPKANPNTSSFSDLWRAYWGVMATTHAMEVGAGSYTQSPYGGGSYTITAGNNIFMGRRFFLAGTATPTLGTQGQEPFETNTATVGIPPMDPRAYTPVPIGSETGTNNTVLQAMFSSPIRDTHNPTGGTLPFQLNPDQVMVLRSALAAVNTTIMRDPLHGCNPQPRLVGGNPNPVAYYYNLGLRQTVHLTPQYDALVYGMMQNPYITEVYINTDKSGKDAPSAGLTNNNGYLGITLFNPYSFDIPLNGWVLALVDRGSNNGGNLQTQMGTGTTRLSVVYTFGQDGAQDVIKANPNPQARWAGGFMLLENYSPGTATDAQYRSEVVSNYTVMGPGGSSFTNGASVPQVGPLPITPPALTPTIGPASSPVTDIFIGSIAGLWPAGQPSSTKELVLLRPVSPAVGSPAAAPSALTTLLPTFEYMPVDCFDFTGLTPPSTTTAVAWHYARPTLGMGAPNDGGLAPNSPPPGTTTPWTMPTIQQFGSGGAGSTTFGNLWRFIYPGRYDGSAGTYNSATNPTPYIYPRQEGVHVETWNPSDPTATNNYEPSDIKRHAAFVSPAVPPPADSTPVTLGGPNPVGSFPAAFPFRYLDDSQPGPNPINAATTAMPPFGGFARDADIAQVPFVGAYVIVQQGTGTIGVPHSFSTVLDYNTVTSDLAMAEDTDPADDPISDYMYYLPTPAATGEQMTGVVPWIITVQPAVNFIPSNEEVGRLAAIINPISGAFNQSLLTGSPPVQVDDTSLAGQYHSNSLQQAAISWRYHWATRLFDFLSVQTPHNGFLPDVDQTAYQNPNSGAGVAGPVVFPTPVSNGGLPAYNQNNPPTGFSDPKGAVNNVTSVTPAPNQQQAAGVEGKININTANWRVLATLPWVPPGEDKDQFQLNALSGAIQRGSDGIDDNVEIAQIICDFRDGTNYTGINVNGFGNANNPAPQQLGPFRSIYDLYRIPAIYHYYLFLLQDHEPSPNYGDALGPSLNYYNPLVTPPVYTGNPVNGGFDGVRNDFEEKANMLLRLSNLITTRSDSFTVYIVVQGWKNAGSTNPLNPPQLVVQKRSAFIADRSGLTSPGGQVKTYSFPND